MNKSNQASKLPDLKTLGISVRSTRKGEGLSQKKLADLVGCSHVSILNLEKGAGRINLNTAWRILYALGMVEGE
ncbi:helix-turn-helix transcriptional regulator [Paremcibacter congregatus]|uniref:helix-turn-helix transcriptional regulator n=1 Tax=Paremcibacter congregatus TaxID=2043170 RepID=UPI003A94E6A2